MRSPDTIDTSLYAKREPVYPKAVDGRFRRFKWAVMILTLGIYYITPWLRWDRGPYAPDQAVLVDLAHRRFFMFGIEIWPQEFYFVAGLLIMAGIGLFLLTSAVGRAWCGYACPQTVWTDLFQHVDRLVDGDRNAQMRLEAAPWGPKKIFKRGFKWSIYLAISFWTGGAWIMYFADAPTLTVDFWTGQAAPVAYATVAVLTATTFILGGFMREQVCVYMCPWPRIQTAMLDEKSLIVTYKDWRGEKRGSVKQALKDPEVGDCIDCNGCVNVCPTGYDIRNGPDIRCITCALCIDECDKVMTAIGRPRGLIDTGIWAAIGFALLFALGTRDRIDIKVQKDRNPPYTVQSSGEIRNDYTVKVLNMQARPRQMQVSLDGLEGGKFWTSDTSREKAARELTLNVPADRVEPLRVYVVAPDGTKAQSFTIRLKALDGEGEDDSTEVRFDSPVEEEETSQ